MTKRENPGIKTIQPIEGNVRILGETTLREMGIESSRDNLNLASDKVTLAIKNNAKLVFFHHAFAGEHFAYLLNNLAPFGFGGRNGILDDLNMPPRAKKAMKSGRGIENPDVRLHVRHLQDPDIGPVYVEFINAHLKSWLKAMRSGASADVFHKLQRITFIESVKDFTSQVFLGWREMLVDQSNEGSKVYRFGLTASYYYKNGDAFISFLGKKRDLQPYNWRANDFFRLPEIQRKELLNEFLEQLTEEEQKEFAVAQTYMLGGRLLVDLKDRQIICGKERKKSASARSAGIEFVGEESIEIRDNEGTAIKVSPNKLIKGMSDNWKVIGHEFSPNYLSTSLYPTIAWERNENGKRRFFSQSELQGYIVGLGLDEAKKGDIKTGEIVAWCFSPDVTKEWRKKMPLKPLMEGKADSSEQRIMGGQMPVWVSLRDYSAELLSDENPFFKKLEEHMDSVA